MLFEVNRLDPAVLVGAAVLLFLLALGASLVPARRAARVNPMEALRSE
jgi:ABC-type lipoprotein release transport system permease subunit